jgi:uncharacterized membrane protein YjjP (DUF1212 family)
VDLEIATGGVVLNERDRFDLIYDMGEMMLENGAEIKRVESVVRHAAAALDLKEFDDFIMINGIFLTARCNDHIVEARARAVPIATISLGRIDAINTLSRELSEHEITPEAAQRRLYYIKRRSYTSLRLQFIAYALGSASFCYVFGGTFWDSCGAFVLGLILAAYSLLVVPHLHMSQIASITTESMVVTAAACLFVQGLPLLRLNSLIVGGIMCLVPGVAIVNAIRYIFSADYTSGTAQMINAVVTSLCISLGVGLTLSFYHLIT